MTRSAELKIRDMTDKIAALETQLIQARSLWTIILSKHIHWKDEVIDEMNKTLGKGEK